MGSSAQASGAQPAAPERPTGAPAATGRRKGAPAGQRRDYPHGLETAKKRLLPLRAPPRRGKDPLSAAARPPALPARWLGGGLERSPAPTWHRVPSHPAPAAAVPALQPPPPSRAKPPPAPPPQPQAPPPHRPFGPCARGGARSANGKQGPAAPSADRRGERPMRAPGGRGELSISGPYLGLASGRARGTAVPSFLHLSIHPSISSSLQPFVSPAASSAVPAASTPASAGLGPVCPRAAPQAPRVWRLPWGSQTVPRRAHREQPPPPPVPEPSLPRPAPAAGQRWPVPRSPRGHLASPPRRSRGLCCHPPTSLAPFLPARGLCGASALIPDCHRHTHPSPALSLPLRPNSC